MHGGEKNFKKSSRRRAVMSVFHPPSSEGVARVEFASLCFD